MATERVPLARDWQRIALWLVGATLGYNVIEAVVAIWSGTAADSIALIGFGIDSGIECAAAVAMLWRLNLEVRGADRERIERGEKRVGIFIGWTFVALALYVAIEAGLTLWRHEPPAASTVGIILAAASLLVMPLVALGKLRAAREIRSSALRSEAKETIACAYLSATLLVGLLVNAALGWWWADPVAALLMVPWLVREAIEGIRGEDDDEDDTADAG